MLTESVGQDFRQGMAGRVWPWLGTLTGWAIPLRALESSRDIFFHVAGVEAGCPWVSAGAVLRSVCV